MTSFREPPLSLLGYAHAFGEALLPIAPGAQRWCSAITLTYIGLGCLERGRIAYDLERTHFKRRNTSIRAGLDSIISDWLALITLQPACVSAVTGATTYMLQRPQKALPSALVRFGPTGAGVAALIATAPLCAWAANAACDFAVRPLLQIVFAQSEAVPLPSAEYVPPTAEELLLGPASAIGTMELDEDTRARLKWAMDGKALSPFPGEARAGTASKVAAQPVAATLEPADISEAEYVRIMASLQRVEKEVQSHMQSRRQDAGGTAPAEPSK